MSLVSEVRDERSEVGSQMTEDRGPMTEVKELAAESCIEDRGSRIENQPIHVSLLTGGGDRPYAMGMAAALTSAGLTVDFIGSDDLSVPEVINNPRVRFLNLRGDQNPNAHPIAKIGRVLKYYVRLIAYATSAKPKLFHLLWNNKFELFDRTLLTGFYKLLGKKVVFTAHNVNAGKRDSNDSWLNRLSLRIQYRLLDHIFVHSNSMRAELISEFGVPREKVSVLPFGINNTVPNTALSRTEAKQQLGIDRNDKTLLFFGNIAPYKGLEYLVAAFGKLLESDRAYRLLVVGAPKGSESYWLGIRDMILKSGAADRILQVIEYVPDEATELYFKAADLLVLPYTHVFQSGVLFLGYSFGVPAVAADVGPLREEIIEGETGYVCQPRDSSDLATTIRRFFRSNLYLDREKLRNRIRDYANEHYSWDKVVTIIRGVYSNLTSGL